MTKILIGKKERRQGYFEIGYTFYLERPSDQTTALAKVEQTVSTTTELSGTCSFKDGTTLEEIKACLEGLYAKESERLNNDESLSYYGAVWDGKVWA